MAEFGSNFDFGLSPFYMDDGAPVSTCAGYVCNDGTIIPPTTALDIIKRALRLLGVLATGETPDSPEANDCLQVLNFMVDQWSNEKLMIYYMVNEIFDITANKGEYTIGPCDTQDFNTTLPIKIESAWCRDFSSGYNNDYKLEIIPPDRYNDIFQKGILTTYPKYLYFERSYPYGKIFLWPVPTRTYKLGLSQFKQFVKFVNLNDIVCLPPGYKQMMAYNLAVDMSLEYGQQLEPLLITRARETKSVVMRENMQPVYMSTDSMLIPRRMYNIYSDRY